MRISRLQLYINSFETSQVFVHGLKICKWFGTNPQIIFYHSFCKFNFVFFQGLFLLTCVDSMYLVRVTLPMNFTFSDDSLFLLKNLGGGHKFFEFACCNCIIHALLSQGQSIKNNVNG